MIHGIGTDLCDVRRMAEVVARRGERFAGVVLRPAELALWQARRAGHPERGVHYLATRFAAKEALAKALGLGMRAPMGWQACEVVSDALGRPVWRLHGDLAARFADNRWLAHLSLSDEREMVAAFVVIEQRPD